MKGRAALLVCVALAHSTNSHQFERHYALQVVGGSSDEKVQPSLDDKDKKSPQPTPTAFMRKKKTETVPKAELQVENTDNYAEIEERAPQMKKRRPKLNLGMGSSVLEKLKGQSSKFLSALGPAAYALAQLLSPSDGKTLITKPAVYALALVGASSGFYLFLYFITVGYCCGVTLPVLVALVICNVSENSVFLRSRGVWNRLFASCRSLTL